MLQEKTALPQIQMNTSASLPTSFLSLSHLNTLYSLPSDLFTSKFTPPLCSKFITQL